MSDDLDPRLLRSFATTEQPLAAEPFVAQVTARIAAARRLRLDARSCYSVLSTILGGLGTGLAGLKRVWLLVIGAAAVTVWAAFL
jgi:hypothetical protein